MVGKYQELYRLSMLQYFGDATGDFATVDTYSNKTHILIEGSMVKMLLLSVLLLLGKFPSLSVDFQFW